MLYRPAILFGCLLVAGSSFGQDSRQPIVIGETSTIESRILGEPRPVYVATPPSYDEGTQRYGVVYVLDGDTQFHHTVASAQFLGNFANQSIPPLLVVGIGNTNRMRDMTPPSELQEDPFLAQGGADQFLRFIVEELKPWIDENYRTGEYSVLVGHSLSGLFALYTFISRPDIFDSYLVIDPSLNWNNQTLVEQAASFMESDPELDTSLYLSVSSEEGPEFEGVRRFIGVLNSPSGLRSLLAPIVAESHDSIPLPGIYQGLQWIFSAWSIENEAETLFSDAPSEEIFGDIDDLYRQSGEQFGLVRETPYLVFESLLGYLAENDRLDEAAELTLRYSDRYPLPLVPNVIAGIAQMFIDSGDEEAAVSYLSNVLEIYPGNETAQGALIDMGLDLPAK